MSRSFHRRDLTLCMVLIAAGAGTPARAGETLPDWVENTTISGLVFGDAYGVLSHHDGAVDGENGFWFRRVYLTFDTKLEDDFDLRLRFEGNSPGDFTRDGKIDPFVKDLYLKWKRENLDLYLGLSPTPTFSALETFWGYRSVEKTPLDLQRLGSSRDTGVAVKGRFGTGDRFGYHLMVGNGSGTRGETDDGKKVMAALSFRPAESWSIEAYADTENRPGHANRTTYQASIGQRHDRYRWGALYARQNRETGPGEDLGLDLVSVFGVVKLKDRLTLLGRIDRMFDPNPEGDKIPYIPFDPSARSTFVLVGLDFAVRPSVSFIPNIETVFYDTPGSSPDPDTDVIARFTFFAHF
ncbi:MAG: hypothetical protein ACE5IK_13015 [Acidobacteriota bacterium]